MYNCVLVLLLLNPRSNQQSDSLLQDPGGPRGDCPIVGNGGPSHRSATPQAMTTIPPFPKVHARGCRGVAALRLGVCAAAVEASDALHACC